MYVKGKCPVCGNDSLAIHKHKHNGSKYTIECERCRIVYEFGNTLLGIFIKYMTRRKHHE